MSDKVFNLQLTIQRLEEELRLYRNGATATELLEIISERDKEVEALKTELSKSTEKLRKIAKSSTQVLEDFEISKQKTTHLESQVSELSTLKSRLESELFEKTKKLDSIHEETALLNSAVVKKDEQLEEQENSIQKLQARCASLVAEKNEKSRQLEKERQDKSKQISDYRAELEKGMKFNMELKEKLRKEHTLAMEHYATANQLQQQLSDARREHSAVERLYREEKMEWEARSLALTAETAVLQKQLLEARQALACADELDRVKQNTQKSISTQLTEELLEMRKELEQKERELSRVQDQTQRTLELLQNRLSAEKHAADRRISELEVALADSRSNKDRAIVTVNSVGSSPNNTSTSSGAASSSIQLLLASQCDALKTRNQELESKLLQMQEQLNAQQKLVRMEERCRTADVCGAGSGRALRDKTNDVQNGTAAVLADSSISMKSGRARPKGNELVFG